MRSGSRVSYTGPETGHLSLGDEGRAVSVSGGVANVKWATGSLANQISPVYECDLVVTQSRSVQASLDDSLDVGGLVSFSARRAYDEGGETGVLTEMVDAGHLTAFADIAEEAIALVANRIRHDPSFRVVVAELDEEEAEGVLRLASACLIRDAFAEED